jgi:hypothetical protein
MGQSFTLKRIGGIAYEIQIVVQSTECGRTQDRHEMSARYCLPGSDKKHGQAKLQGKM